MRKFLALGLLMALFIGTASAALFESGTKDAQPMVLYGKYNNTIVPVKVAADGSVGGAQGEDSSVIFNVKTEYGAAGDGVELVDGSVTNADKTFTSATASFTSADVGKVITIQGAGGTNIDLTTTIASVTSATEVELTDAAGATVDTVRFTYGTDDTTEIQAAIDAIGALATTGNNIGAAGTIFFPAGIYIVNGGFTQVDNSQLGLPTIDFGDPYVAITLQGSGIASHNGASNNGSIIFSTNTSAVDGSYSIISGRNAGQTGDITDVRLSIRQMRFRTVQDPKHSGIDLVDVGLADMIDVILDTSVTYDDPIAPTTATSYGIKLPGTLTGNHSGGIQAVKVKTFYNGILFGEHSTGDSISVIQAVNGLVITDARYPVHLNRVSIELVINSIVSLTGSYDNYLIIDALSIEHWNTGNFVFVTDFIDVGNKLVGRANVTTFSVGGATTAIRIDSGAKRFTVADFTSGNGVRTRQRGNVTDLLYLQSSITNGTSSGGSLILQQNSGTAISSGHRLGAIGFSGAYNSTDGTNTGALIAAFASQNYTTSSTGGTDLVFSTAPTGSATRSDRMVIKNSGNIGIGITEPTGMLVVNPPAAQTIAAGNTVLDDSCGTLKLITAAGAVTTDTTNTFTAPAAGNEGCIMHVCNVGSQNITLDNNANFKSAGGADVVLTADDCVTVGSTGASGVWYQLTPLQAN